MTDILKAIDAAAEAHEQTRLCLCGCGGRPREGRCFVAQSCFERWTGSTHSRRRMPEQLPDRSAEYAAEDEAAARRRVEHPRCDPRGVPLVDQPPACTWLSCQRCSVPHRAGEEHVCDPIGITLAEMMDGSAPLTVTAPTGEDVMACVRELAASLPPRREGDRVHAAPGVVEALRMAAVEPRARPPWRGVDALFGLPVCVDNSRPPGTWELRDGDRVVCRYPEPREEETDGPDDLDQFIAEEIERSPAFAATWRSASDYPEPWCVVHERACAPWRDECMPPGPRPARPRRWWAPWRR